MLKKLILALLILVFSLSITSCGTSKTVSIPGAGNSTLELEGDANKLPSDFPSDVAVYDGKIEGASKMNNENATSFFYTVHTKDDWSKVETFYKDAFSKNGWTISSDIVIDNAHMLGGKHAKYSIIITFDENERQDGYLAIGHILNLE